MMSKCSPEERKNYALMYLVSKNIIFLHQHIFPARVFGTIYHILIHDFSTNLNLLNVKNNCSIKSSSKLEK